MGELLEERLGLQCQVKDTRSGGPLKVLELRSDVCTPGFQKHDWCVGAGLEKQVPRSRKISQKLPEVVCLGMRWLRVGMG